MSENPQAQAQAKLESLRQQVQDMQKKATLSQVTQDIQATSSTAQRVANSLTTLSNYAYIAQLTSQFHATESAWQTLATELKSKIDAALPLLRMQSQQLEMLMTQAALVISTPAAYDPLHRSIEDQAKKLGREAETASRTLRESYKPLKTAFEELARHIDDLKKTFEHFNASGIALQSGEMLFVGCRAEWVQTGKASDDPDGNLYVTNQRIIFEQSEKKGKFLGIFGGKQVQAELWSAQLAQLTGTKTERKGFLGGKGMLTLSFAPPAEQLEIVLEVKGGFGNTRLEKLIQSAKSGDFKASVDTPEEEAEDDGEASE
jgi:DNA repair exonuclease SbcCD ATPase subunit